MKLTTRAFLVFCSCLTVLIGSFIIILSYRLKGIMYDQIEENLKHQILLVETIIQPLTINTADSSLVFAVRNLAQRSGNRITYINHAGQVIADSEHDPAFMDNHLTRQEIRAAMTTGWGMSIRHSNTLDIDFLYLAKRVEQKGQITGYLRLAIPLDRIGFLNRNIFWLITGLAVILLVLVALTGYYYSTILRKPLKDIALFCAELTAGNFRARLIKPASGSIADLYKNLNNTAENLDAYFQTITRERDILSGILAALEEGVVVTDEKGVIIMMNERFKTLFLAGGTTEKKNIWEIIHDTDFLDLLNLNKTNRSAKYREFRSTDNGKTFRVSVYYTPVFHGWIYAFQDITEAKNLEKIKADFITNLSHELRTPLTAIKGYVETLEDNKIGSIERTKYLKIIRENTDRIIAIVSDLLKLSDIERPENELDKTTFDLNQVAADIILLFQKEAQEKNLSLEFKPQPIPEFFGDRFMIQQIIMNLVSNGLKFTEKGRVTLEISFRDGMFIIKVTDTGIGIQTDEIPRIFERFYRVDKSRSRAQGGTGLGLAIVKHSALAHGGKVFVESQAARGSIFTVILPHQDHN